MVGLALGNVALVLGALVALSLAAPTINAAEGGVAAERRLVVVVGDGRDSPVDAAREGASAGELSLRSVASAPDLGPAPAFPPLPGWGWVVLGLICFSVVLGLAWPDERDR